MAFRLMCRLSRSRSRMARVARPAPLVAIQSRATGMYCMQCEQTSHGTGCTSTGICGKSADTANMQDLLLHANNGLCQFADRLGEHQLSPSLQSRFRSHLLESTFSTLTNVNFSEERMAEYVQAAVGLKDEVRQECLNSGHKSDDLDAPGLPSSYVCDGDLDQLAEDSIQAGLHARMDDMLDADCFGLRECAQYGLKGVAAYFAHAEALREENPSLYTDEQRDEVYARLVAAGAKLCEFTAPLGDWLQLCLSLGELNLKVMALLDGAHTSTFGHPNPTEVSTTVQPGPCVLLSGHDIHHLRKALEAAQEFGVQVYTHGELLPAHAYPELTNHPNLGGHFGGAWQQQVWEFRDFPGPVVMTSNCLMPPRRRYRPRLYTTKAVGYDGIQHLDVDDMGEWRKVMQHAVELGGADAPINEEAAPMLTGFGHQALLSQADKIVAAVQSGALQHIFVIGGCDGTEKSRSYFTELAKATPEESVILTLGCGKFRLQGLGLGELGGNSGIPRVLDVGQCNDAYSAVVVAQALAEALGTDVHSLPLHFGVSWFEQKAVAVLLTLLHIGIKDIRLGPAMPAFLTPNVRKALFDSHGLRGADLGDEQSDMDDMLAGR